MRSCALSPHIRRAVRLHQLFGAGDRLIVAVSGGADSTALAHVLPGVAASLGAQVVGLAHLNHGLRAEAADDEAACEALASQLSLPFFVDHVDVAAEAHRLRTSIEDAGRIVRYAFLEAAAAQADAIRIAVAHTQNDQAETMLLRLVRGAGPVGLAGIYPRAGLVVRPLLLATRREIETWLRDRGIGWREDASNRDVSIPRNRIRHELMPWLREHFGPSVDAVMARQADVFREDAERLDSEATEIARDLVLQNIERSDVPLPPLLVRPPAMVRRVLLLVLRQRAAGRFIGLQQVDQVLALATGDDRRASADLPGQRVERRGDLLMFQTVESDPLRGGRRRGRAGAGRSVSKDREPSPSRMREVTGE
jgi:tRNA(Ile)-lysidine synthase